MKPTLLYRTASGLLVFFAFAHTVGMLKPSSPTPEASAVRASMDSVHFQFMNFNCSYGAFYFGFGMLLTAYLLFAAFLSWRCGDLVKKQTATVKVLAWPLFAIQVVVAILGWLYFFLAPAVVSTLAAICLALAAWKVQKS